MSAGGGQADDRAGSAQRARHARNNAQHYDSSVVKALTSLDSGETQTVSTTIGSA